MKILKHKFIFMTGLVAAGLVLSWWIFSGRDIKKGPGENIKDSEERIVVRIFEITRTRFSDYLEAMGTIKGNNEIELKFPNTGYLAKINFIGGDWIEEGEVIAELDLREAELRLEKAKIEFENAKKMYGLGAVLKDRYEEARLNFKLAEAEQRRNLILSPFKGVLGEIEKEKGELVTPNDKIANFIEASSVYLEIGIIEKEIKKISEGQTAEVKVDTYPEKIFKGKVAAVVPIVTGSNRTMQARIRLGNPKGELLPGMFGRVRILIYEKAGAMVVPVVSLFKEGEKFFVFKVLEGKLAKSEVIVSYFNEEHAEIKDGVSDGDAIALKVMGEMGEGKQVEIID